MTSAGNTTSTTSTATATTTNTTTASNSLAVTCTELRRNVEDVLVRNVARPQCRGHAGSRGQAH